MVRPLFAHATVRITATVVCLACRPERPARFERYDTSLTFADAVRAECYQISSLPGGGRYLIRLDTSRQGDAYRASFLQPSIAARDEGLSWRISDPGVIEIHWNGIDSGFRMRLARGDTGWIGEMLTWRSPSDHESRHTVHVGTVSCSS